MRRRRPVDRRALAEECRVQVAMAGYAYAVDAPHAVAAYEQACDLAARLELPAPPTLEDLGVSGPWTPYDDWLVWSGLS